ARVDVVLENTPPPGRGHDAPPPDDVEFARIAVVAGDRTLCDRRDGIFHDRTRFIVRGWVGAEPPRVMVREDLTYLETPDWLPPFDARAPISDALANELAHKVVDSDMNGDVQPAAFPLGIPLDSGPITHYMPMVGGRNDIGVLPSWAVVALQ